MTLPKRISRKSGRDNRIRSPAHLKWVRGFACSVPGCGATENIEAAHVRNGTNGGTGMKPGDNWAISLCRTHHSSQHRDGEVTFSSLYGIDMKALAMEFAAKSPALRQLREPKP